MISESPHADLLAMCLADAKALELALARGVAADAFPAPSHRMIFQAIAEAERAGRSTRPAAIALALPEHKGEILALRREAHVGLNADYFVDEVLTQMWQRDSHARLVALARSFQARQPFQDTAALRGEISEALNALLGSPTGSDSGPQRVADVLQAELEKMEREILDARSGKTVGIPTGIDYLDALTSGGLKRGSVNVFAARTGVGKTTLALNLAHHAATQGFATCYFTVEMPAGQLARKLLSALSRIRGRKLTTGALNDDDMDRLQFAVRDLYPRPIWFDDSFKTRFEQFELSCRKLKRQGGLDVVVVDYIQQLTIQGRYPTKQALLTEVSHRVKQLAIDLDIAVIALAQFNREAEKADGEPSLWQVKDSGAIEQDADLGVCLYRDKQENYWLKVDKNRWGKDRVRFPIVANLALNSFSNAALNLPTEDDQ